MQWRYCSFALSHGCVSCTDLSKYSSRPYLGICCFGRRLFDKTNEFVQKIIRNRNGSLYHASSKPMLRAEQNGRHFTGDIFKLILYKERYCILIKIHLILFLRVQLTISHHRFKWWHDAEQLTGYCVNHWSCSFMTYGITGPQSVNTLRLRQGGCLFADIFRRIFLNEKVWISIKISLKFVP